MGKAWRYPTALSVAVGAGGASLTSQQIRKQGERGKGNELRPEAELAHNPQSTPFQTYVSPLDSTASLNSATSCGPTVQTHESVVGVSHSNHNIQERKWRLR